LEIFVRLSGVTFVFFHGNKFVVEYSQKTKVWRGNSCQGARLLFSCVLGLWDFWGGEKTKV
jgi:hypothetical protein